VTVAEILEVEINRVQWVCHGSAVHAGKSARQWPPRRRFRGGTSSSFPQCGAAVTRSVDSGAGRPTSGPKPRAGFRLPRSLWYRFPRREASENGTSRSRLAPLAPMTTP
jgi:hypothetical protein